MGSPVTAAGFPRLFSSLRLGPLISHEDIAMTAAPGYAAGETIVDAAHDAILDGTLAGRAL